MGNVQYSNHNRDQYNRTKVTNAISKAINGSRNVGELIRDPAGDQHPVEGLSFPSKSKDTAPPLISWHGRCPERTEVACIGKEDFTLSRAHPRKHLCPSRTVTPDVNSAVKINAATKQVFLPCTSAEPRKNTWPLKAGQFFLLETTAGAEKGLSEFSSSTQRNPWESKTHEKNKNKNRQTDTAPQRL